MSIDFLKRTAEWVLAFFFEHVHFTFNGNYLLAKAVMDRVEGALPRLEASRKPGLILTKQQCAERIALTPWDEYQSVEQMAETISRPPFTNQLDYEARMAAMREQRNRLRVLASAPDVFKNACHIYLSALEKSPDDWLLHHRFGKLALAGGEIKLAAEQLRIAREKYPWDNPGLYFDLGYAEQLNGNIQEAMAHYRKALEIDPKQTMAHSNLGVLLAGQGKIAAAMEEYQKALDLDANNVAVHLNFGGMLAGLGRIEDAIPHFQSAIQIDPGNAMGYFSLGKALAARGYKEEAAASFQKALEIKPDYGEAYRELQSLLHGSSSRAID
jgi:Flp pilus assembly protein TadD